MARRSKAGTVNAPTLFEMGKLEIYRPYPYGLPNIFLGTSAFTANGWSGSFYPAGMKPSEYLTHYAKTFQTVEIDSSFYATPAPATVKAWYAKTPPDFVFAVKVPQEITHKRVLANCEAEFGEFIENVSILNEKLGPIVFQFPHFDKYEFKTGSDFLDRLQSFLKKLPPGLMVVVEIRNKSWLNQQFLDVLREHRVALALTDTSFMPRPWELQEPLDLITANFGYVRWLGNRKQIERITTNWDKPVVDRKDDLQHWVTLLRQIVPDKGLRKLFAFANNHYAGNGPNTVSLFWELWNKQ
jgi:uncharacterized protein YecE (DUF72 family)